MDANLSHSLATGKSLTGCLQFVNRTPVNATVDKRQLHMVQNLLLQKQQQRR